MRRLFTWCWPTAHPVLRLLSVLFISLSLALGWAHSLPWVALLTGLLLVFAELDWRTLLRAGYRLRWLLLSLLLLHAYFTPGPLMWPSLQGFSPSIEGLRSGAGQAAALLLMVIWARWMQQGLSPDMQAQALLRLLRPLAWLGVPVTRFACRLSLTLHGVDVVSERLCVLRNALPVDRPTGGVWAGLKLRADLLSGLFAEMEKLTLQAPLHPQAVAVLPPWRGWDWFALMVLSVLLIGVLV